MVLALVAAGLVMVARRRVALLPVLMYGVASVPLVELLDQASMSVVSWAWILATAMGLIMALAARGR